MRLRWLGFLLFVGITCLLTVIAHRKSPSPTEPGSPAPNPVFHAVPPPHFSRKAVEIHHAAQEMALDGFQFGKNHLGWPFEVNEASAKGYFEKLIREGFLPSQAGEWYKEGWMIANLSDADPGETVFLKLVQPDKSVLLVRKDGRWAIFGDGNSAAAFGVAPPREPAWLP
jgi:hypothetical protein